MALSLAACGGTGDDNSNPPEGSNSVETLGGQQGGRTGRHRRLPEGQHHRSHQGRRRHLWAKDLGLDGPFSAQNFKIIRLATLGGGAYLSQVLKSWWSGGAIQHLPEGVIIAMVPDAHLDGLFVALRDDPTEANINAWNDYFDSMAYGYSS